MATSTHSLDVARDTEVRLRTLFTTYAPAVGNYLARRFDGGVDIDELVDETFVILWRRLDEVPRGQEFPWIIGVARNVAHNARRAHLRRQHYERLATVVRERSRSSEEEYLADAAGLAALEALSSADREILRLHAWEGLEAGDLAIVLGLTANAAATRLSRAKARFLAALSGDESRRTDVRRPHI
jgi:RNA polymerase sigma-70 factor, ECF subfamily